MSDKLALVDITGAPESGPRTDSGRGIASGSRVGMHFSLALENGEIIDSNFDRQPVAFTLGDGSLLPGFENCLLGLEAGSKASFILTADQAFGAVNEDNIQRYPRYQFPADLALEKGLVIAFNDAGNNEQTGVIVDHDKTYVTMDFNHPLAGRTIIFTVEILSQSGTNHDS
ncbi:MAG: peptidylprolyl isomerase [Pseudohongiellaceae bacterium]